MRIGDVYCGQYMRERPGMMYRLTAMHHYDQRPFATDEIDQKLEESIYGEGLSDPETCQWRN